MNVSLFQVLLDVIFKFSLFGEGEGIDFTIQCLGSSFHQVYGNVPWLMLWELLSFFFRENLFPLVVLDRYNLVPGLLFFG
jgi:hypothetical protein